ncbi:MAG TPA: hypothetical protein VFQ43_16670 [Nitrososphaera sp.]|nr:hypothetical protein [Nitrososphaera sp.]
MARHAGMKQANKVVASNNAATPRTAPGLVALTPNNRPEISRANLDGAQIHSLCLSGYVRSVEAIFGARDELLIIRHDAGNGEGPNIEVTLYGHSQCHRLCRHDQSPGYDKRPVESDRF